MADGHDEQHPGTDGGSEILPPAFTGNIVPLPIEDEIRNSYLTYAMSVIVSRALPDVRDGLKPSQRRILDHVTAPGRVQALPELGLLRRRRQRRQSARAAFAQRDVEAGRGCLPGRNTH